MVGKGEEQAPARGQRAGKEAQCISPKPNACLDSITWLISLPFVGPEFSTLLRTDIHQLDVSQRTATEQLRVAGLSYEDPLQSPCESGELVALYIRFRIRDSERPDSDFSVVVPPGNGRWLVSACLYTTEVQSLAKARRNSPAGFVTSAR